jgi:hypothetical protein
MLAHSYEKAGDLANAVAVWRQIQAKWPHGTKGDPTSADVDRDNLQRDLAKLNGKPGTGGASGPHAAPIPRHLPGRPSVL